MTTINQGYITLQLIGDVNPFEYGGTFLQVHPEQGFLLTHWEPDIKTLYRIPLEPHTYTNQILSANRFHAGKEDGKVWYHDKIPHVAKAYNILPRDLIGQIISHNTIAQAQAIIMIADYYGWEEFDQYPLKPETPQEVKNLRATFNRWKEQAAKLGR